MLSTDAATVALGEIVLGKLTGLLSILLLTACGSSAPATQVDSTPQSAPTESLITAADLGPQWKSGPSGEVLGADHWIFVQFDCNQPLTQYVNRSTASASAYFLYDGSYDRTVYQQILDLPTNKDAEAFLALTKAKTAPGACPNKISWENVNKSMDAKIITNLPAGAKGYTWLNWSQASEPKCNGDRDVYDSVWTIVRGKRVYVTVARYMACVANEDQSIYQNLRDIALGAALVSAAR